MNRPHVHLEFGARQTGKSTLLRSLLPADAITFDLASPLERLRHLSDPGAFVNECSAMRQRKPPQVDFVDESQSVPSVCDSVQDLYDTDRSRWRFVLCGSSARQLRRMVANLPPGWSFYHRLHPLTPAEHPAIEDVSAMTVSTNSPSPLMAFSRDVRGPDLFQ